MPPTYRNRPSGGTEGSDVDAKYLLSRGVFEPGDLARDSAFPLRVVSGNPDGFWVGYDDRRSAKCRAVEALVGRRVKGAAAGGYHTVAWTDTGELLTWGRGVNGHLGHGEPQADEFDDGGDYLVLAPRVVVSPRVGCRPRRRSSRARAVIPDAWQALR